MPEKDYEELEVVPKKEINIKSSQACGNDFYLMDCRGNNTLIFYDILHGFSVVKE